MQMQIPLVTMKKLLIGLIRAEVVVLLTADVVSIPWAYRDLAKGSHRRMVFLDDPSSQFRNFLAKIQKSTSTGRCALRLYGVCMSALMTEKIVWSFRNLMSMLCHGGLMLSAYAVITTSSLSSLGVI
jgi:hypothetical protein